MVAAQLLLTVHAWHLVALQEAVCLICIPSLIWQALDVPARGTIDHDAGCRS